MTLPRLRVSLRAVLLLLTTFAGILSWMRSLALDDAKFSVLRDMRFAGPREAVLPDLQDWLVGKGFRRTTTGPRIPAVRPGDLEDQWLFVGSIQNSPEFFAGITFYRGPPILPDHLKRFDAHIFLQGDWNLYFWQRRYEQRKALALLDELSSWCATYGTSAE